MRRTLLAATGFILTVTVMPSTSSAAGNVLLPTSSDDSTPSYLGLVAPSATVPATPAAPAQTPAPISTPTPAAPVAPASAPEITAAPAVSQTQTSMAPAPQLVISPIDRESAARLAPGEIPTQVIQQPDDAAIFAYANKGLPYRMTFAIDSKSMFASSDIQEITGKLGLSRDQIPTSCILTVLGVMQTDKGSYIISGPATPHVTTNYDGQIQSYMMTATALCTAGHLPPNSGFLSQINGRYRIPLQQIECPVPTQQATELVITYNGTSEARCAYQ